MRARHDSLERDRELTPGRLGPEHKFPTGINDCWDALKWVSKRFDPFEKEKKKKKKKKTLC